MKKVVQEIGSGDRAINKTVKNMWRLINRDKSSPIVLSKAKELRGKTTLQTIKNVYRYVANNFDYKSDPPGVEHFTAPKHLIAGRFKKYLDCDDMVGILAALLLANDIPVQLKTIAWRRFDYTHIILLAKYKNMWIPLDPVQGNSGFGDQIKKVIREKKYRNPMGKLVTLEDGCCGGSSRSRRGSGANTNTNVIMIGNSAYDLQNPKSNKIPVPAPKTPPKVIYKDKIKYRDVVKRKEIPYPVYRKVKTPVRVIAKNPVVTYKEFY